MGTQGVVAFGNRREHEKKSDLHDRIEILLDSI